MTPAARMKLEAEKVAAFNAEISVGSLVDYLNDNGENIETSTRTVASLLSGHTAVVWLEKVSGCVSVDRVSLRDQS